MGHYFLDIQYHLLSSINTEAGAGSVGETGSGTLTLETDSLNWSTVPAMLLILDSNSEHLAHGCTLSGFLGENCSKFETSDVINNCL